MYVVLKIDSSIMLFPSIIFLNNMSYLSMFLFKRNDDDSS